MHIHVLGSGAGGGFPQWNCNCANCSGFRSGTLRASARTQSSIAVSADRTNWVLINASPDVRSQVLGFPGLQPARAKRDTGIRAVVLVDSQIDHTTGLLILRESNEPLELYCTDMAYQDLTTGFPVLNMLQHYCGVNRHPMNLDEEPFTIPTLRELRLTAIPLASKAPPYSPHRHDPHPGDNVGLLIEDVRTGRSAFYAPGLGGIEEHLRPHMDRADCLLVDGTFWTEDEMIVRGVGRKRASDMGHLPQSGAGGMLEVLRQYPTKRRVLIHINNTNPILDEDSAERANLADEGIEVAYDGMGIEL